MSVDGRGSSWVPTKLAEIARVVRGRVSPQEHPELRFIGMDNVEAQTMRLLGTQPSIMMKSSAVHFQSGDVLYGRLRPYLNKVVSPGFEGLASAEFIPLTVPQGVVPKFALYRLNSADFVSYASHLDEGDRPRVNYDQIGEFLLELPPTPEQHRIVEAIESYFTRLDDAVATLERVQRNLKRYRASVLKAAVEGRLVPTEAELARAEGRGYEPASVLLERILAERRRRWEANELAKMRVKGKTPTDDKWKAKYQEPAAPDTSELPDLPEGWCWASLPQLGELNRGKSKHRPRNDPRLLGGPHPFIQTGDVRHSDGFITEYSSTYSDFGLAQSRLWPAGTLCITIAANIAETGILKFNACFPDSVVGFLPEGDFTLLRFIELFLRTAKQNLERYAPATAQKNINLEVLSAVAVPLPPHAEQARIVTGIDRLLSVGGMADQSLTHDTIRVVRLRQSILKWAFEGRLADQDPTDEPASALLERIKAERAASATKTPARTAKRKSTTA